MRRAVLTDGTSGCSASALHGQLARAGARGLDRRALDVLDRLDQRAGVVGHVADRDRHGAGACRRRTAPRRRRARRGTAGCCGWRCSRISTRRSLKRDRLDDGDRLALVAADVLPRRPRPSQAGRRVRLGEVVRSRSRRVARQAASASSGVRPFAVVEARLLARAGTRRATRAPSGSRRPCRTAK